MFKAEKEWQKDETQNLNVLSSSLAAAVKTLLSTGGRCDPLFQAPKGTLKVKFCKSLLPLKTKALHLRQWGSLLFCIRAYPKYLTRYQLISKVNQKAVPSGERMVASLDSYLASAWFYWLVWGGLHRVRESGTLVRKGRHWIWMKHKVIPGEENVMSSVPKQRSLYPAQIIRDLPWTSEGKREPGRLNLTPDQYSPWVLAF